MWNRRLGVSFRTFLADANLHILLYSAFFLPSIIDTQWIEFHVCLLLQLLFSCLDLLTEGHDRFLQNGLSNWAMDQCGLSIVLVNSRNVGHVTNPSTCCRNIRKMLYHCGRPKDITQDGLRPNLETGQHPVGGRFNKEIKEKKVISWSYMLTLASQRCCWPDRSAWIICKTGKEPRIYSGHIYIGWAGQEFAIVCHLSTRFNKKDYTIGAILKWLIYTDIPSTPNLGRLGDNQFHQIIIHHKSCRILIGIYSPAIYGKDWPPRSVINQWYRHLIIDCWWPGCGPRLEIFSCQNKKKKRHWISQFKKAYGRKQLISRPWTPCHQQRVHLVGILINIDKNRSQHFAKKISNQLTAN